MYQMNQKLYFGLIGVMIAILFLCTEVTAVEIEKYNPKLEGTQGIITKISGKKITLKDGNGEKIKVKVKDPETLEFGQFKVGNRIQIKDGEIKKIVRHKKNTPPPDNNKEKSKSASPEEQNKPQ